MSFGAFNVTNKLRLQIIYILYMHKQDLALNKQQDLIYYGI